MFSAVFRFLVLRLKKKAKKRKRGCAAGLVREAAAGLNFSPAAAARHQDRPNQVFIYTF